LIRFSGMKQLNIRDSIRFLPSAGIVLYIGFYLLAAYLYPGGSRAFPEREGFDWQNSYWCNLTDPYSINGEINTARPYAMFGVVILCLCLAYFFYSFPRFFKLRTPWNKLIEYSGGLACTFALLIHTDLHDSMAVLASVFGSVSIISLFLGLRRQGWVHFIWTGCICILMVALNGYIYFTGHYIELLPIIQKITFVAVLLWFLALNLTFSRTADRLK